MRQGSSVRGAIDMVAVAGSLAAIRAGTDGDAHAALLLDAAIVALSARITLDETSDRTPEEVIRELWEDQLILRPHRGPGRRRHGRSAEPHMTAGPGTRVAGHPHAAAATAAQAARRATPAVRTGGRREHRRGGRRA